MHLVQAMVSSIINLQMSQRLDVGRRMHVCLEARIIAAAGAAMEELVLWLCTYMRPARNFE
jgi:hypothetical protein